MSIQMKWAYLCLTSLLPFTVFGQSASCPKENTPAALTAWRADAINKAVNLQYTKVKEDLQECFGDKAPSCMKDLNYYVNEKINPMGDNYPYYSGLEKLYSENVSLKSEKELPEEFLAKDVNGNIKDGIVKFPSDIYEIAKKKNWPITSYKTRDMGGFDPTNNLVIVAIPGPKKDIVMQISIDMDASPYETILNPIPKPYSGKETKGHNTLTIISVDKTVNPPVGQLRALLKTGYDDVETLYAWQKDTNTFGTKNCIQCHASPFRAISPVGYKFFNGEEKSMGKEQEKTVDEINKILSRSGVSWGSAIASNGQEVRFGPPIDSQPLGWAPADSVTRKQEFIEKCSSERQPVYHKSRVYGHYKVNVIPNMEAKMDWQKISKAMNCVSCHNGKNRGVLHTGLSESTINFKVAVSREMPESDDPENPLHPDLNPDERLALLWCLKKERQAVSEEWRKSGSWLQKTKCN
jgi:hypothetical protein